MADRYWVGGVSGDTTNWNNSSNWASVSSGAGGAGIPTSADAVYFDANSNAYNCVASSDMVCYSLLMSGCSTSLDTNTYNLTTTSTIDLSTTGDLDLRDSDITINGDGDFTIGSGVGTLTVLGVVLYLKGTGSFTCAKTTTVSNYFYNIICSYTGKTTTFGAYDVVTRFLTTGSGTLITGAGSNNIVYIIGSSGYTWTKTNTVWQGYGKIYYVPASAGSISVPAIANSDGGSVIFESASSGTTDYTLMGNFAVSHWASGNSLISKDTGTLNFNSNGYSVTKQLLWYAYNTSILNMNLGSSYWTVKAGVIAKDAGATINLNLQTGTYLVSDQISYLDFSSVNIDAGTSTFILGNLGSTGAAELSFTPKAGTTFYHFRVEENNGWGWFLGGNISCYDFTVVNYGNFRLNNYSITALAGISFTNTLDLELSGDLILTGDGDINISSSIRTLTVSNCDVDMRGTGNFTCGETTSAAKYFSSITGGYTGKTTTIQSSVYTNTITTREGTLTSLGNYIYLLSSSGMAWTALSEKVYGRITYDPQASGTISLPVVTGSADSLIITLTSHSGYAVIYNMTGTLKPTHWASRMFLTCSSAVVSSLVLNTNGYSFGNGYYLALTTSGAAHNLTINAGSSAVTLGGSAFLTSKYAGSTIQLNMQTSNWTFVSGSLTFAGITVDAGTSALILGGPYSSGATEFSFVPPVAALYDVFVDMPEKGWYLGGNLLCNTLETSRAATFDTKGYSITASSYLTFGSTGFLKISGTVLVTGTSTSISFTSTGTPTLTGSTWKLAGTASCVFSVYQTGLTFPQLTFEAVGKIVNSGGTADWTATRLLIEPGTTLKLRSAKTVTVTSYTAGDWDGTLANPVLLESTTAGSRHTLANPAGMNVSYMSVKDSDAQNEITSLLSNGNVDRGNNLDWFFGTMSNWFLLQMRNQLAYSNAL